MPKNLEQLIAEVAAQAPISASPSTATPTASAWSTTRASILFGDQLLVLLAATCSRTHPGATIIADVKASQVLFDEVAAQADAADVEDRPFADQGEDGRDRLPLAGEMCGHVFFADRWYGFDDALYAAVRLLGIVARMPGSCRPTRDALPQMVNTPELRFDCDERRNSR